MLARLINIQERTSGTIAFNGNLSATGTATGIAVTNNTGGTINFSGATKTLTTGANTAVNLATNTGATINFTNGGLAITTTSGTGFLATGGGTINVTGAGNSVATTTGQILNWNGVNVGASGVTFASLASTGTVAADAISLNNVDGGTFNGGAVTIAGTSGAGSDGIAITGGSAATFNFASATIDNTSGNGINLDGANGAVTFTTVDIDGTDRGRRLRQCEHQCREHQRRQHRRDQRPRRHRRRHQWRQRQRHRRCLGHQDDGRRHRRGHRPHRRHGDLQRQSQRHGRRRQRHRRQRQHRRHDQLQRHDEDADDRRQHRRQSGHQHRRHDQLHRRRAGHHHHLRHRLQRHARAAARCTVQGTGNTITSTTGTALNIANTTIGAAGLTFQSISAGTAVASAGTGIILDNTGSSGGLTVTGTGTAGSGGTIQNKNGADIVNSATGAITGTTGTGIFLRNTFDVDLSWMTLQNFSNYGVLGSNVNGFVLRNSVVSGTNGDVSNGFNIESSIGFQQLTGVSGFVNNNISGGIARNINIDNQSGTLNLTVTGNNIHNTSNTNFGDDGISIEAELSATVLANISNNTFSGHKGDDFNLSLINNAVVDLTFNNNSISNPAVGGNPGKLGSGVFILGASFNGSLEYDISNNNVLGAVQGGAIFVNKGSGTGTFSGQIVGNIIGNPAVVGSGAAQSVGIHASARGAGGSHTTLISNNQVYQYFDRGIVVEAGEGAPTLNVTVTNNTVSNFADEVNSLHGIHFDFGILSTDNAQITMDVRNNLIANAGNEAQGGVDFRMRVAGSNDVFIAGYSGGNSAANAQAFIDAQNPDGTSFSVTQAASGTYNNGPASPLPAPNLPELPTAPGAPMMAASGGVEALGEDIWGDVLTGDTLDSIVAAAIERWAATGLTDEQLAVLNSATFEIADLGGNYLGLEGGSHIRIDDDGAGYGWYVDATPLTDEEFANRTGDTQLIADGTQAPAGQYDLLTVIMHEFGHLLGYERHLRGRSKRRR